MSNFEGYIKLVELWAVERDIHKNQVATPQALKNHEEATELLTASVAFDHAERGSREMVNAKTEMVDAIGDNFVTLIIMCQQRGIEPSEALAYAYKQIKDRTGKTINGQFIKDE
jgi:hypothetical protein